ncbi:MAG TPA: acyl-CoA dehydrogenase family protein [Bradyrhizobium sp.]|nr:acyl-CoA dehydrogenase family protein [Bradyrhizobium sp.]
MRLQSPLLHPRSITTRNTNENLLASIQELASEITARAAEIEAVRRVPLDLVDRLRSIGMFRIFVPRSHGGLELPLPEGLEVITALARLDGSIGWTAMVACASSLFATLLPRETYDRIYQDGPDVAICGSSQPAGTAEPVADGFRINGRWPFASGCMHANWMGAICKVIKDGEPVIDAHGKPMTRGFVLPASDLEIEDTWYAAGLKGTGSHHIAQRDALVPEANIFDLEDGAACVPGPLYQAFRHFLPLFHGAFSVGMAAGTIDELVALANTGRQQLYAPTPMRESETFQFELGRISAGARAAQAFHKAQTAGHWDHALAGTLKGDGLLIDGMQSAVWIVTTCVGVADGCFTLGGSSALYETSPLQRRLRDLHVAAQHAIAQQRQYTGVGKLALQRSANDA